MFDVLVPPSKIKPESRVRIAAQLPVKTDVPVIIVDPNTAKDVARKEMGDDEGIYFFYTSEELAATKRQK